MNDTNKNKAPNSGLYGPQVLAYISNNYDRNLVLEDVASYFHLNKCYFCSVFKKGIGENFLTSC